EFFISLPDARQLINYQSSKSNPTPLHIAAYWGAGESESFYSSYSSDKDKTCKIIQKLLEYGADPFATFIPGWMKREKELTPYEYGLTADSSYNRRVSPDCAELKLIKDAENQIKNQALARQHQRTQLAHSIAS